MALVEIDVVVQRVAPVNGAVYVVDGASVYVERADGTAIAVWTTQAGNVAATLPLTSKNGRVYGWVEGGLLLRYRAVHPSLDPAVVWEYFIAGGPVGPAGPEGPAGPSAADGSISVVKTGVGDAGLARGAFHIYATVATAIPASTNTVVPLAGVTFDVSTGANGTGYTVPVSGVYRLTGQWRCAAGLTNGVQINPGIQVNGAIRVIAIQYASGPDSTVMMTGLVKCVAGDTIRLTAYHTNAASVNTQAGAFNTLLCGELVGRT